MSKRKKKKSRRERRRERQLSKAGARQQGKTAFRRGDYALAIAAWRRINPKERDPALNAALAEAHFRRSLAAGGQPDDLNAALALVPDEPRFVYHQGLLHHRAGDLEPAEAAYRRVVHDPHVGPRAAYALALVLLERGDDPHSDGLWEHLTPAGRARLAHARKLAHDRANPDPDTLWSLLTVEPGDAEAQAVGRALEGGHLPGPVASLARYYLGVEAWAGGDPETALSHWQAAHSTGLDTPWLRANLAVACHLGAETHLAAGQPAQALALAEQALALGNEDEAVKTVAAQAHFRVGNAAAERGDWAQALTHWQAARDLGETSRRLVINLALAHEKQEHFLPAAELWREALRRRPRRADHPDALDDAQVARLWQHVAENYRRAGQLEEGLETYRRAIKWAPDDTSLRLALVDALLYGGRWQAASNELKGLLATSPDDVELLDRLAQTQWGRDDSPAAVATWQRILELDPQHADAGRQLARHYKDQGERLFGWGRYKQARTCYQKALEYTPQDGVLHVCVGECYLYTGDADAARQHFDRAFAVDPTNLTAYFYAIRAWLSEEDGAAAEAVLDLAAAQQSIPPGFYLDLAEFCLERGERDRGREFLQRAEAQSPDAPDLLLSMSNLFTKMGDMQKAVACVRRVIELDPDDGVAHIMLATAYAANGQMREARDHWRQAERIARRTGSAELQVLIEMSRLPFEASSAPLARLLFESMEEEFFDDDDF